MSWTKTHITKLLELLGHASNLSHILSEKKKQLFPLTCFNICSIYSFLHLFSICIQQGEIKLRWDWTSSKHSWWLCGTWKIAWNHHWYSRGAENGFLQSVSSGLSVLFNFFRPFLFFILSVWEQGRRGGSVLKRKSSLLCGRSHRLRLADGMTGQSRYPEHVSYHGNCCNFAALRVIAFASAVWCDSREMSVWGVTFFFPNHIVDRVNTKLCRVWNPDRVKLLNLSLGEQNVMFSLKNSEGNLSQPRKLIEPRLTPTATSIGGSDFF